MNQLVFNIRLQRVIADILIAISLAPFTLALQKVMRNDLVDPYIIGSLPGAFVSISLATLLMGLTALETWNAFVIGSIGAAFSGTLVSLMALRFGTNAALLSSIGLTLALQGLASVLAYLSAAATGRPFLPMLLGTTSYVDWGTLRALATVSALSLLLLIAIANKLSVMEYGEEEARSFGIRTNRVTALTLLLSSITSGAAVSCCGILPFIGLVSANLAKRIAPLRIYREILFSFLIASTIIEISDTLANYIETPYGNLPLGAFLSFIGGFALVIIILKESYLV